MTEQDSQPRQPTRAALYVDFDNVFMALLRWDERAAYAFGERPDVWLAWLEGREADAPPTTRRTLVRRCYLNPGGYHEFDARDAVARYRAARQLRPKTYHSEFRTAFVQAGFEVVDCPPVTSLKNTADMKMALDIREALDHPTRFDEFVLLSGDSDFLPALARLRAHDRRITILSQGNAKRAYLAAADVVFALEEFVGESMRDHPIAKAEAGVQALSQQRAPRAEPARVAAANGQRDAALAWLREALAASPAGALRLTQAGSGLLQAIPGLRASSYAGAGSLRALVEDARDARLALSGPQGRLWLYDPERTAPPGDLPPGVEEQPEVGEAQPPAATAPLEAEPPAQPEPESEPPVELSAPPVLVATPPAEIEPQPVPPALVEAAPPAPPPPEITPPAPPPAPEAPPPRPAPAPEPPAPPSEQAMAEAALLVRDILWGGRDQKRVPLDLPAFSPAEIGFVLNAIAPCQPFRPQEAAGVAAEIAAEAAGRGLFVSAREVTAIFRWLIRNRYRLDEAAPEDAPARLAITLHNALLNAIGRTREQLSPAEKDALRAWCHAGLRQAEISAD